MNIKRETHSILPLYEAIPDGEGPFPTIILFMHAHGIDDSSKKVINDLAQAGYYAVGMDSYLNGKYSFQDRSDELIFSTFDVAIHWLKKQDKADLEKLGAIGFCMGGRHVYLANAYYDYFKAIVSYYGFPHRGKDEQSTPQNLIDQFTAPVLSIFGSEDRGIPLEAVENYKIASNEVSQLHKTILYDGAGHGFLNPYSRNHHEEASEKAWNETLSFFEKYLH